MLIKDFIVDTFNKYGVKRVYAADSDEVKPLLNAFSESAIRIVKVAHEEAGGFASGADAAFSKTITGCVGNFGSGSVRFLNGLYDSARNGSPVVMIACQTKQKNIGYNGDKQIDFNRLYSSCSIFCEEVESVEHFPKLLQQAMQAAMLKKGLAVLVLPFNMIDAEVNISNFRTIRPVNNSKVLPSDDEINTIAKLINKSKKPFIYGGAGCENAHSQVMQLASLLKAPVGWAYRGKHYLDYDNPCPVGMTGLLGEKTCLYAMHECDLLILLGTSMAFNNFYTNSATIIQIDIDGSNLGRRHWIDVGLVGDIALSLDKLIPLIKEKTNTDFADRCKRYREDDLKHLDKIAKQNGDSKHHIYPEFLAKTLNDKISKDAYVVSDIGSPWAYMAKYIDSFGGRKLYHSCLHGTMANCLSSCIGIQSAFLDKQVVAMCGDGGFTMLMGDILTIKEQNLPVKIFIFNNKRLDFVALEMKTSGLIDYGTDLLAGDFAAMGESIGIKSLKVNTPAELAPAIDEALSYKGAVLVDVTVNSNSLLMPPVIMKEQALGFAEYIWKAFTGGQTKTLEEMFEVNFPRQL